MNIPDIEKLLPAQCRESHIRIHYPEFYKMLNDKYPNIKFGEKMYWYYNNINERPKCPTCGKSIKFINSKVGYALHCCSKCSNSDLSKIKKTQQIFIERYGGKAPICNSNVLAKMKTTNIERYGVENCQQNKDIKEKTKKTLLERYGGRGNASAELKQKYVNTCNKIYGVDNSSKSDIVKEKISQSRRKHEIDNHKYIIDYKEDGKKLICICSCPHKDCNKCKEKTFEIESSLLANRTYHNIEICTHLLPYSPLSSTYEICLQQLLDKYNIEYISNDRKIISKELDIFIPSKNIAIEFNGVRWHSDIIKPNNYHAKKFVECHKKGIQLISIWDDQYGRSPDICKSIILSKLGIYENKLYARKCQIYDVSGKIARKFYNDNHIQGACNAKIHYGLYYNDELIAMMSFGKRSLGKKSDNCWELIRYCSKINTIIVGGASKLFRRFVIDHNPEKIVSWSSNDISIGNMYKSLGFSYVSTTMSYWYVSKDGQRYHRSNFSKSNMIRKGIINKDDDRTESEILTSMGFYKIWDSGQTKWIWTNKT